MSLSTLPQVQQAINSLRESIDQAQREFDDLTTQRKAKRAELKKYRTALSSLTGEVRARKQKAVVA